MPQVTAYKVDTLVGVEPDAIVALKVPNENKFELYVTSRTGIPFPLKEALPSSAIIKIKNTDGNLTISGTSTVTINISNALLTTINSALQAGDNISQLVNNAGYITIADVPTFAPSNYDLQDFTNISLDPFVKTSELTIDLAPTDSSINPVSSNGVFDALALKQPIGSYLTPASITGKENTTNKQNSLTIDGTGTKFPTVDAVFNALALKVDKVTNKSLLSDTEITRLQGLSNTSLSTETFTFSASQSFVLTNIPVNIVSVVVNMSYLHPSQYTLVAPKTITINDTLDVADKVSVTYNYSGISQQLVVINTLTSTSTVFPVSAMQAKILSDRLLNNDVFAPGATDTLRLSAILGIHFSENRKYPSSDYCVDLLRKNDDSVWQVTIVRDFPEGQRIVIFKYVVYVNPISQRGVDVITLENVGSDLTELGYCDVLIDWNKVPDGISGTGKTAIINPKHYTKQITSTNLVALQSEIDAFENNVTALNGKVEVLKNNTVTDLPLYSDTINAVNGWIVGSENGITKSGIPSWGTGTFKAIYDSDAFDKFGVKNVVKLNAIGNDGSWQSQLCIQITKQDLINAGANFVADNVFVSIKFVAKATSPEHFFALRYAVPLNFTMSTSPGGTDALFMATGKMGIAGDDNTTFSARVDTTETLGVYTAQKLENLRIPAIYKGMQFVGIMMLIATENQSMTVPNDQIFLAPAVVVGSTISSFKNYSKTVGPTVEVIDNSALPEDVFYAAIGDSITNANHLGVDDIVSTDPYLPFDGYAQLNTYKRKNYAYYIAKKNRLKWANYGWGGTTMIDCTVAGVTNDGFVTNRYLQLKAGVNWDYISLFFGANDVYFGVLQQKEIWLQATYGGTIYYPKQVSEIGTTNYATQAQYDACNAVTGVVHGVNYIINENYFYAKFLGYQDSTDKKTWWGAWNFALEYLIINYPTAKILIILPYTKISSDEPSDLVKDTLITIANRWNLPYYDFRTECNFLKKSYVIAGGTNLQELRKNTFTTDNLHPSNEGYKYIFPSIGAKLMSI